MKNEDFIHYHHIGGRGGSSELNRIPNKFHKDFNLYLYDADKDSLPDFSQPHLNKNIIFPYLISDKNQEKNFYLYPHSHMSSVYELNNAYSDYLIDRDRCHDCLLKDMMPATKPTKCKSTTLDSICDSNILCDFLSIDAQGSEFDILKGASGILTGTSAIVIEVSSFELYKGQKTFPDICTLLNSHEFECVEIFFNHKNIKPFCTPTSFRTSKSFGFHSDALFLKKHSLHTDPHALIKLAFISLCYGHIEYSLKILTQHQKELFSQPSLTTYSQFLENCLKIYNSSPKYFNKKMIYTSTTTNNQNKKPKKIRFYTINWLKKLKIMGLLIQSLIIMIKKIMFILFPTTQIEKYLKKYKFHSIAHDLKKNRVDFFVIKHIRRIY